MKARLKTLQSKIPKETTYSKVRKIEHRESFSTVHKEPESLTALYNDLILFLGILTVRRGRRAAEEALQEVFEDKEEGFEGH